MRYIVVLVVLVGMFKHTHGQDDLFKKSYVITSSDDNIYGNIKITTRAGNLKYVKLINNETGKKTTYRADKVKGFVKGKRIFNSRKYKGSAYFFNLIIQGEISLYVLETRYNSYGFAQNTAKVQGTEVNEFFGGNGMAKWYYLEKDGVLTKVGSITFKSGMSKYVKDFKELSEKISNRIYKFRDIEEVVLIYNEWYAEKKE